MVFNFRCLGRKVHTIASGPQPRPHNCGGERRSNIVSTVSLGSFQISIIGFYGTERRTKMSHGYDATLKGFRHLRVRLTHSLANETNGLRWQQPYVLFPPMHYGHFNLPAKRKTNKLTNLQLSIFYLSCPLALFVGLDVHNCSDASRESGKCRNAFWVRSINYK